MRTSLSAFGSPARGDFSLGSQSLGESLHPHLSLGSAKSRGEASQGMAEPGT